MKKKGSIKSRIGVVLILAIILAIIIFVQTVMVFEMTATETRNAGQYQLQSISGELESTIAAGKNKAMLLALQMEPLIDNKALLTAYINKTKEDLNEETHGSCYNIYAAGTGWDIIPDLVRTEDFVATDRSWYIGAKKANGEAYITSPYVDAWTGNVCYSISIMLEDKDTVIGIDYTLDDIESYILEMDSSGSGDAVIVTEDGIIAGYANKDYVSGRLDDLLPQYEAVFSLAKNHDGVASYRLKSGNFFYDNMFATKSMSGWYLIVSENDWDMYKKSYLQLAFSLIISIMFFSISIVLYWMSKSSQDKAEEALSSRDEFLDRISSQLREPLRVIMMRSKIENNDATEDYYTNLNQIQKSSKELSQMIERIISYSSISKADKKDKTEASLKKAMQNAKYRSYIIALIIIVMIISAYSNISATYNWGVVKMQNEVNEYEYQLQNWVAKQKSILDMYCSIISNNPKMLEDYDYTIEYLNSITVQYPEISVSYMTNPNLEHTVYMNNGWEPNDDWHVEERQWYIDTENSADGWSISAPYYDEQTGLYCVTISEIVYDANTGDFLGIFGIDFYMDKLVEILGSSYSTEGYAFLVDGDGEIINHPNGKYQMSESNITNISELEYGHTLVDGKTVSFIKDYDGERKLIIASRDNQSGFSIYLVSTIWTIFKNVIIYGLISIIVFLVCIVAVFRVITRLIEWQNETNESLKESAQKAILAGKAKSEFLAQMSHEIRTPINAVLGMNEMILRETDKPEIKEYANNIKSAGRTLLSLINSILDFSKIEDGKMEIVPATYETATLINDVVNAISGRAQAKGLELEINVDENLPDQLFGDDVRIKQVIMNLLTNAVKYTEKGKVTANFKAIHEDDEFKIRVEVKDTGIGIREEDMEKLFESFQRLDEKRNRNIEGTGLGMAIVTKLLAMMGSSLEVSSVYGEGSEFSFSLTQGIAGNGKIGNYHEKVTDIMHNEKKESYLYANGVNILLVDDNKMNLMVAEGLLKRNGIVPDTAVSGAEAIGLVKNNTYDILFIDHMMPIMDGIETLNEMKKEKLISDNAVTVALTANAISGAREKYLELGFTDYLSKPIEVDRLEKLLAKYLPSEKYTYIESEDEIKAKKDEIKVESRPIENKEAVSDGPYSFDELMAIRQLCPEINIVNGMSYCMNNRPFYESMLEAYISEDKADKLCEFYENKDFDNYRIMIHSVKSTSLNIGADVMSQRAKELEFAIKEGNTDFVLKNHEEVINQYRSLLEKIATILKK